MDKSLKVVPFLLGWWPKAEPKERGSNLRDSVANNPGSWNPWTYSPDRQVPTSRILLATDTFGPPLKKRKRTSGESKGVIGYIRL